MQEQAQEPDAFELLVQRTVVRYPNFEPWIVDLWNLTLLTQDLWTSYYTVYLRECHTSAAVLDYVLQVHGKPWGTDAMAGLLQALKATLDPQATICRNKHGRLRRRGRWLAIDCDSVRGRLIDYLSAADADAELDVDHKRVSPLAKEWKAAREAARERWQTTIPLMGQGRVKDLRAVRRLSDPPPVPKEVER